MGEKPTQADEADAAAPASTLNDLRSGAAAVPGDPIPDIDMAAQRSEGAPLKGVDVKLG